MKLREYIESFDRFIIKYFEKNDIPEVIIYGTNNEIEYFIRTHSNLNIKVVVSEDYENKNYDNIKVISMEQFHINYKKHYKDKPIFIVSKWTDQLSDKLKSQGIENFYHYFAYDYLMNLDKLDLAMQLFKDDISITTFKTLVKYLFTQDYTLFEKITFEENQYFIKEFFEYKPQTVFIDGGGYHGENTIEYYRILNGDVNKIYVFEPDVENFKIMKNNLLNEVNLPKEKLILKNNAISDKNEIVYFSNENNSSSCIVEYSEQRIKAVSLDSLIKDKVDFIKLDIEGNECKAIKGSRNIILDYNPKLAICLYHRPKDMWEIPLLIKEINPKYKFMLRHHNRNCWYETVLYCK
ncbi:methyltransferase FkbM family [Gottschalkia purinilytica]|uniref:Methyltransferase FkbM family n=1 Tax=Gottschalkia purinilytica TaxID=1503 RepID=A0A0L0WE05_GOTPU|nr:FkbM family methyltransferase [Gottschalkia purinilytica]KNF09650.1 methyltransferase FkbM family [Gottschalkia purinilytica]